MKKITITIEISNVEEWDTNWEHEDAKNETLEELKIDIKRALKDNLGIYYQNVEITNCKLIDK